MSEGLLFKAIIPLEQCTAGMKLMQPIVDIETGNIIIANGQVLTDEMIKRLGNFKHTQVWIAINTEQSIWKVSSENIKKYERYTQMLKHVMEGYNEQVVEIGELFEITEDIIQSFKCSFDILACVNLIKDTEEELYKHSINVAFLALLLGRWQGFRESELTGLVVAGLLHDIGKLDVPKQKASKVGLEIKEEIQYRRHPIYSYERLKQYNELDNETLKGILTHHERCDGSGFPLHLKEDHINNIGKILALADEYDKLKKKSHMFEVIKSLRYDDVHKFDMSLVLELCTNVANYYIGAYVLLSTGEMAKVVLIHPNALHRPLVKIGERYVELTEEPSIKIEKIY